MAGFNQLRKRSINIKIAHAIILEAQFINLLASGRIIDLGHDKQNEYLHIQHIVNKAQSLHIDSSLQGVSI